MQCQAKMSKLHQKFYSGGHRRPRNFGAIVAASAKDYCQWKIFDAQKDLGTGFSGQ